MTAGPRVGRRGMALLFFAVLDVIYAFSLVFPDRATRDMSLFMWLAGMAPLWAWACLWGGVGLTCAWHAFRRCDRWGFTAAIALKVLWGCVCLGGWLVGGVDRGYVAAVVWLAFGGWVATIAGWPEPNDLEAPAWIRRSS